MDDIRHRFHRWLFHNKDGQEIVFSQKNMPFAIFKPNAVWGGSCEIGGIKCRIRIRHNMEGEKGKRIEVWFPHKELNKEMSFEDSTLVGYMEIQGSWQKKTGKCIFRRVEDAK